MREYLKFNKEFKKFLPIFLIILAVVLLMGTSYALLRSSDQGENTYVMSVGLLEVTFQDSVTNSLNLENAVPMADNEGMNQASELTFTVQNTGDLAAGYDIYIEETSTSPELLTLPVRAKTFVPLESAVPMLENHSAPFVMITGIFAQVSTLLIIVGQPHKPFCAGKGGLGVGIPRRPSIERNKAVSSPHTKAPAPKRISISKSKPEPKMSLPRSPKS